MRIFALQTDPEKIKKRFLHEGEELVYMTYYHWLSFVFAIIREIIITVILIIFGVIAYVYQWPMGWVFGILFFIWMALVFYRVFKAFLDWTYDFIIVTTDKLIFIDQTSIIKQEIMPIHIENIGGSSTFTQFMDIFPFGGISIHLKEGKGGKDITRKYVPNAKIVAGTISDVVTTYQRHGHQKYLKLSPHSKLNREHDSTSLYPQYKPPDRD
ncbi:MAG: hypothetical protein QF815_04075 [Candidatus Peribacteraceae bacterium]|jgi:hypothetical protein|nr:hypothetical protein [Candidatus Peribacteraceae bacterium]